MSGLLAISAVIVGVGAVLGASAAFWAGLVLFALWLIFQKAPNDPPNQKKWAWGIVIPPFIFMRRGDNQR